MNNLTETDVKTVSDAKKQISWLRKMVAKHFLSKESSEALTKNPEIQPIFRKYLKTGSISNSEVKQVFMYVKRLLVVPFTLLGTVALGAILYLYNPDIGLYALSCFPLVFVVMFLTFSHYKVQKIILPLDAKQAEEWDLETAKDYTAWWGRKLVKIKGETGSWKF
tara:strand:+ start:191 stop:685 length:495 start_codon:yes stop_codon:yes gene_type:complete